MKILTCNVRCIEAHDGDNHWEYRKKLCIDVIRSQQPDIVCFQEMRTKQFADVSRAMPEYNVYAMADEPVGRNPQNAIIYRSDAFTLISAGGYWLSETPHVPGSRSWQSACIRLANWIRLQEHATGVEFRVVNTHLDHKSQAAREQQALRIAEDTCAYPADYPQLLTGDMNCDFQNAAIDVLKSAGWLDTYADVHGTEDPGHTYHQFLGPQAKTETGKMDWIFMRGLLKVKDAAVIKDSDNGRFPSDHYFVSAVVE